MPNGNNKSEQLQTALKLLYGAVEKIEEVIRIPRSIRADITSAQVIIGHLHSALQKEEILAERLEREAAKLPPMKED